MSTELHQSTSEAPRYQLRARPRGLGWSIEKLVPDTDFDPPVWVVSATFGPFTCRADARDFMLDHGGRP